MSKIQLIRPTLEYAEDILNFRREILAAADADSFAGCCNLEDCQTAEEWIETAQNLEKEETCPKDRVVANIYILNSRLKIIHCSQSFDFSNFLQNSV